MNTPNENDKDTPLREDIRLLGRILGNTVRAQEGDAVFEQIERIRQTSVRFHRDADHAARQELEGMLRETPDRLRMGITLPPSGKTRLKGLYIDGQPAEDYLRRNPAPLKPDSTFETGNGMTP